MKQERDEQTQLNLVCSNEGVEEEEENDSGFNFRDSSEPVLVEPVIFVTNTSLSQTHSSSTSRKHFHGAKTRQANMNTRGRQRRTFPFHSTSTTFSE